MYFNAPEEFRKLQEAASRIAANDPEEVERNREAEIKVLADQLEAIARVADPVDLFVAAFAHLGSNPEIYNTAPTNQEFLAYYLFKFINGSENKAIRPDHILESCALVDELVRIRLSVRNPVTNESDSERLARQVQEYNQIVRGSAYPEQISRQIIEIQGNFETWYQKKLGIGPNRAQEILWKILRTQDSIFTAIFPSIQAYANKWRRAWTNRQRGQPMPAFESENGNLLSAAQSADEAAGWGYSLGLAELMPRTLPIAREALTGISPPVIQEEWDALQELLGFSVTTRQTMQGPDEVRQTPLFILPDGRVLLGNVTHALELLWEKFEGVAKQEQGLASKYSMKKAKWLEDETAEAFSRVFPDESIYRSVSYPDLEPGKPKGAVREMDLAIQWGPFLLLIEIKAKQFRTKSRLGQVARLRSDLKDNIEAAYAEQAQWALQYIEQTDTPEFIEKHSGRSLTFARKDLRRFFVLNITQHQFSGLATRLPELQALGMFKDDRYPISMSISDLDIVTQFCGGPEVLVHYFGRRDKIQTTQTFLAQELELFGFYLENRLLTANLFPKLPEGWEDAGIILGPRAMFDEWMDYRRGKASINPIIELQVPDILKDVFADLRQLPSADAKWIAFTLLGLSDDALKQLAVGLIKATTPPFKSKSFRTAIIPVKDLVITLVAAHDGSSGVLLQRVNDRTRVEKYRYRVGRSIGIGIDIRSNCRVCYVCFEDYAWQYDPEIEHLSEMLLGSETAGAETPITNSARNSLCPCGSGKKYKKCCLLVSQALRASRTRSL